MKSLFAVLALALAAAPLVIGCGPPCEPKTISTCVIIVTFQQVELAAVEAAKAAFAALKPTLPPDKQGPAQEQLDKATAALDHSMQLFKEVLKAIEAGENKDYQALMGSIAAGVADIIVLVEGLTGGTGRTTAMAPMAGQPPEVRAQLAKAKAERDKLETWSKEKLL